MAFVVIGGTFDGLHRGHRELIRRAFGMGGMVLVGLTSDAMVGKKPRSGMVEPYAIRKVNLAGFLEKKGWLSRAEIVMIRDPFSAAMGSGLTHIVVSEETRANAEKINDMRRKGGLPLLEIVEVGMVLADDGEPISDARIRRGEIDVEGRILR